MRRAEEAKVWQKLKARRRDEPALPITFGKVSIDLAGPCVVLGGRNGTGKSRLLRAIDGYLDGAGLYIDLHLLCEQALAILRSREDFAEMTSEFDVIGPEAGLREDVERVIGREYSRVEWYALEVEPSDDLIAERFTWGGDQPLVPYFDVEYRGRSYTSREMGLGEFSVHFLFWILEQYRHVAGLTLLIDEPDAYLPEVGASSLLVRLLNRCSERDWRVVIATHSAEMTVNAVQEEAFVLLHVDDAGDFAATHCRDDPTVADVLLARPSIEQIFFVEDESAWSLATALFGAFDRQMARSTALVWGNGSGYLTALQEHLPRPPVSEIRFGYLFDGDKRTEVRASKANRWPALFLPTEKDPDELFKTLRTQVVALARRLNVPELELSRFLDSREGFDSHDWVNDLGATYGRPQVLRTLAELWVDTNENLVRAFGDDLKVALTS